MSTSNQSRFSFGGSFEYKQLGSESTANLDAEKGGSSNVNEQPTSPSAMKPTNPFSSSTNQQDTPAAQTPNQDSYRTDVESGLTDAFKKPPAIVVTQQTALDDDASAQSPATYSRKPSTDGAASGAPVSSTTTRCSDLGKRPPTNDSAWPTRRELKEKALLTKRERMRRNWNCLSGLTHRQRLMVRVIAALVIIGAAVGIGIGISVAVDGGVYKSAGQQGQINTR